MRSLIYIIIIFFYSLCHLQGQNMYTGWVMDGNNEALPYAHVYFQGTTCGTSTNEEGYFSLSCSAGDTMIVSYVGYRSIAVAADSVRAEMIIRLTPQAMESGSVTIYADDSYLYKAMTQARNLLRRDKVTRQSKSYLIVSSQDQTRPIEVSESYRNASVRQGAISDLQFKNGRSYLLPRENGGIFMNMDISTVFSRYALIHDTALLPSNPLQLSRRKLRKHYQLRRLQENNEEIKIGFRPRDEGLDLFSGYIWLDKVSGHVKKLHLAKTLSEGGLFKSVRLSRIDSMRISLDYAFSAFDASILLRSIALDYQCFFGSSVNGQAYSITSQSVLHLYDYSETFFIPAMEYPDHIWDYRQYSIPLDTIIWNALSRQNNVTLTERQKSNLREIKEKGWRFHDKFFSREFDQDSLSPFFESNYKHWSPRLRQYLKPGKTITADQHQTDWSYRTSPLPPHPQPLFLKDKLNIETILYFDYIVCDDTILWESSAILDPFRSYNLLPESPELKAYINIYFDLTELYRRKLEGRLQTLTDRPREESERLYTRISEELKLAQMQLEEEAFAGRDIDALRRWNDLIKIELGIDNLKLFPIEGPVPRTNN